MRILGIDPGLDITGYGIIENPSMVRQCSPLTPSKVEGSIPPFDPSARSGSGIEAFKGPDPDKFKLIEAGVIRTGKNTPIQDRARKIFDEISGIVEEHNPIVLVLEKIYSHYKHPTTAILMGHARAMACLVCGKFNVELVNYPSTRIKKVITGNGHASKTQVQRMVQSLLKLKDPPEPVDVSDALAMAMSYCYIEHRALLLGG